MSELRALCLSLREARARGREQAGVAEFRRIMQGPGETLPEDPRVVRAGLRDLWIRGEYGQIVRLGKRLPSAVLDADETILMYVTCAESCLPGGPATSTTA